MDTKIIGQKYNETQNIYIVWKYFLIKYLWITKGDQRGETWKTHTLTKANISNRENQCHVPDMMHFIRSISSLLWWCDQKCIIWISPWNSSDKYQTNSNGGTCYREGTFWLIFKTAKVWKHKERLKNSSILKETKETLQPNAACGPGLDSEPEKDISVITGEMGTSL